MNKANSLLATVAFVGLIAGCASMDKFASAPDYHALVANADRSAQDRKTDERRKPEQLLAFTGVRPGMRVLDMGAGAGYSGAPGPRGRPVRHGVRSELEGRSTPALAAWCRRSGSRA